MEGMSKALSGRPTAEIEKTGDETPSSSEPVLEPGSTGGGIHETPVSLGPRLWLPRHRHSCPGGGLRSAESGGSQLVERRAEWRGLDRVEPGCPRTRGRHRSRPGGHGVLARRDGLRRGPRFSESPAFYELELLPGR